MMVFPVVVYGCESWPIKKAEHHRIDAVELWCWRRLLRIPWTARRSNQSILMEISPEYSLEGLMLKLKLQYSGHLMRRADTFAKTLRLGFLNKATARIKTIRRGDILIQPRLPGWWIMVSLWTNRWLQPSDHLLLLPASHPSTPARTHFSLGLHTPTPWCRLLSGVGLEHARTCVVHI